MRCQSLASYPALHGNDAAALVEAAEKRAGPVPSLGSDALHGEAAGAQQVTCAVPSLGDDGDALRLYMILK